jgi:tRNA G37 N-methylase TrmD
VGVAQKRATEAALFKFIRQVDCKVNAHKTQDHQPVHGNAGCVVTIQFFVHTVLSFKQGVNVVRYVFSSMTAL